MITRRQRGRFLSMVLGIFTTSLALAQTNCFMQISSSLTGSVCPGTPIVLTATTAAVNVGTGINGSLTVSTGTAFTDGVRAGVVGTNITGLNNKVRVASVTGFATGDEVMLITMQDPNLTAANQVGKFEFAVISSISADTLRFSSVLTNTYNTTGSVKHQVIEVPHYTNLTIANGALLTCNPWNGTTGGVLCFRASGQVSVAATGSISASEKGYRGVAQKASLWRNADGGQGEGIYGTGIGSGANGGSNCGNNGAFNSPNGNGGGGGNGCGDSGGGGGGGYASAGSTGVNWGHTPGLGGNAIGNSSLTLLYMGGAGGEGGADEDGAYPGAGGNGSGIVFLATNTLIVNGFIQANGAKGNDASNGAPGSGCGTTAGGGGAGGSIVLQANSISGTGANITVNAGTGGISSGGCNGIAVTGGNGSVGRIRIERVIGTISTSPAAYQITVPSLTGLGYLWSTTANTATIGISPTVTSVYNVTITSGSSCVGTMASFTVPVRTAPILNIAGGSTICSGQSLLLTASGATSYTWTNGNTNGTTLNVSPVASTVYTLTGTDGQGCVAASVTRAVSVYSLPIIGITGNSVICAGQNAALTGTGASTYSWSTGSNATVLNVSPATSTLYTLTGSSSDGCTGNTANLAVTVNTVPVLAISGPNAVCAGGSIMLTASGANTYTWMNSGSVTTTLTISPASNQTYSLTGSSLQGCLGTMVTQAITVNSLPIVTISGSSSLCAGQSQVLTANGASTYTWMNNNSNLSTFSISPTSNQTYTLSGTSVQGCVGSVASLAVSVFSAPVVAVTGTNAVCQGATIALNASGANTYTWTNTNSNGATLSATPTQNTTYTVNGTSSSGCVGTPATLAVVVNTLPVLSISGTNTLCAGGSVVLIGNGANTYVWTGVASSSVQVTVSPSVTTTYSLNGRSMAGCDGAQVSLAVTVFSLPVVAITGTSAICAGGSAILTATGATNYTWTNSGANTTTLAVAPTANTTYSLAGINPNGCQGSTALLLVNVFSLPVVSIAGTNTVCSGGTLSLTANGASTYTWLNTSSTATGVSVNPTANTTYTLRGVSAQGCAGTNATLAVTAYSAPVLSIAGPSAVCNGASATFTGTGANAYLWLNNASTGSSIAVTPSLNTTYSLTGTSSFGCAGNTATVLLTVNANPTINVTANASVCAGASASLTATGASNFTWTSGATTSVVVLTPSVSTNYSISGTFTTGCSSSKTVAVTVYTLPVLSISGTSVICAGDTAQFTASGASVYLWNTGANTSSVAVTPSANASYTLTGTSGNGCVTNIVKSLTVNPLPVLVISGNNAVCQNSSVTKTVTGANSYTWSTGVASNSVVLTPTISSGYSTYSVTGLSLAGCLSRKADSVLVNALPTLTITGGSFVCAGNSLTLDVSGANSYSWSTGSTTSSVVVVPLSNTSYSVTGTNTTGCFSMAVNDVTVVAFPSVSITGNTAVCVGDSITLTANGANTYVWSTGSTSSLVVVSPTTTSTYSLVGSIGIGCSDTTQTTVNVNALPVLTLKLDRAEICVGESNVIEILGANSYSWSTGAASSTISVTPTLTTTYSVAGTSTDNCSSTSTVEVKVSDCTGITASSIENSVKVYPNPFNDKVSIEIPQSQNNTLQIVSSVGQILYTEKVSTITALDLTRFDNGMYLIRIVTDNGTVITKTIVKQ